MIKRILPFVLVVAVLLSVMTVPASAVETSGAYVNVFDFVTANNTLNNTVTINSSGSAKFDFATTLGSIRAYYFELVFAFTGKEPTNYALTFGSHSVPVSQDQLSSGLVKLSGNAGGLAQSNFNLKVTSPGSTTLSFVSFIVYKLPDDRTNIAATVSANPGTTAVLSPGGSVGVQANSAGATVFDTTYNITITKSYWDCYDYIELRSSLFCLGVRSIDCISSTGDYFPIDVSHIGDGATSVPSWCFISCRIDLTGIDPSYDGDLFIRISATNNTSSGLYYVDGLQGIIISEPFDSQMTWYQLIYKKIDSFLGLVKSFFNNNLTPALASIYNSMSSGFSDVISKLGELVAGSPVDEGVSNDMQQSENELGNMTDQMDQLSPTVDVGDVNVNIDDYVDADSNAQATDLLVSITSQPIAQTMFIILSSFALMGYVFFGKR